MDAVDTARVCPVLVFMAAVSLRMPLAEPRIAARWFSLPNFYFLWPVSVVTALTALAAWRWLSQGREVPPFLAAITLFMLGYLGLVISNFPYLGATLAHRLGHCRRASEPDIHAARHAAAIH
jgi:cytochrome bd-type quinol oxidase subunit 2